MVSVEWSEAIVSCAGSVSQYVLSVTPPTSDCQSGLEGCQFMTNNMIQFNLTLSVNQTYSFNVTAQQYETCNGSIVGNDSDHMVLNTEGQ